MEIKAVKFRKNGFYGQPFAFGGEEVPDKFDPNVRYRGSLQSALRGAARRLEMPPLQAGQGEVQQSIIIHHVVKGSDMK